MLRLLLLLLKFFFVKIYNKIARSLILIFYLFLKPLLLFIENVFWISILITFFSLCLLYSYVQHSWDKFKKILLENVFRINMLIRFFSLCLFYGYVPDRWDKFQRILLKFLAISLLILIVLMIFKIIFP